MNLIDLRLCNKLIAINHISVEATLFNLNGFSYMTESMNRHINELKQQNRVISITVNIKCNVNKL